MSAVIAAPATPSIGPAPTPTIAPDPRDAQWDAMTGEIGKMADEVSRPRLDLSQGPQSGQDLMHHPDDLFPAASLIKVPVMIAAFYKIRDGQLALDERIAISRHLLMYLGLASGVRPRPPKATMRPRGSEIGNITRS